MKRDLLSMSLDLGNELIIDNFAGGGGTSTGLEWAFGRPVDIAINHDPEALAMHAINHPHTKHLCESVWDVDPIEVTNNRPVGLVWLSPDCKHFSKAKGGKPVEKRIRGLAWVTMRWAAKCKPRVIMLENVEEFKTWGPLMQDAEGNWLPDPKKRGKTFESFIRQLRGHGYEVDYQELRACDHDTPTIRKRFFLIARRDGLPILWPKATHGAPTSREVIAGKLRPYRTAAECIDWSLPCPSIFGRKKELAPATLRRIAKGIMRYVVDAEKPFIVTNTTGHPGAPISEPVRTVTTGGHHALVVPSIVPVTHQGGDRNESVHEPFRTITGAQRGEKALAAATLVQTGYGERDGQAPRALDIDKPLGTVVAGASKAALVTAFLNEHANASNQRIMPADEPLRTICAQVKGGHFSMVAASLVGVGGRAGDSRPRAADEPTATITAKGDTAIATAFLAKHYTGVVGSDLADPIGTVTSMDHHSLITSNLVKLRGTSESAATDEPLHTVSAGGQHHAEVRAFLVKYYGTDQDPRLEEPLHTVTTKDRYGLVTIQGVEYQIVDIGLRMLAPHELYRAQGFPESYIINEIPDPDLLFANGEQCEGDPRELPRKRLTKSAQVRMCGNSVCPPLSFALIHANFAHERQLEVATAMTDYERFIQSKLRADIASGFDCDIPIGPLFDFQAACVRWALMRGRAALFLDTGLGKTFCQSTWAQKVVEYTGGNVIIVAPLCVAQQTVEESAKIGIDVRYCRDDSQVKDGITITNYEMLEHFDLDAFAGVVLDESSILKSHTSKTREALVQSFRNTPYKLSCTATPSPNDYIELGNQADFLGVMNAQEMLATFFTHDGGDTSKWRLKGHGKVRFWEWMATWSICIRNPSDLGFDGSAYELPPLNIVEHTVDGGQLMEGQLFHVVAQSLSERREAKRNSMADRVALAAKIANEADGPAIVWCHLNDESTALTAAIPDAVEVTGSMTIDQKSDNVMAFTHGARRVLVSKPSICGAGMNWQHCNTMIFAGMNDSFEEFYQAVRRCWRFGQKRPVTVHVITAETEGAVKANIDRKQRQATEMAGQMFEHMRGITQRVIEGAKSNTETYAPAVPMVVPNWIKQNAESI